MKFDIDLPNVILILDLTSSNPKFGTTNMKIKSEIQDGVYVVNIKSISILGS